MAAKAGMDAAVLYYTEDPVKARQVEALCMQFGYRMRLLKQEDAGKEAGVLAGITKAAHPGAETKERSASDALCRGPLPEHMIFSGILGEQLDAFLQAMRMAGIAPVPLKAVLTPYNFRWSLYELVQELQREHTAMMMERRKQ